MRLAKVAVPFFAVSAMRIRPQILPALTLRHARPKRTFVGSAEQVADEI